MKLVAEPFWVSKRGNREDECDDAPWPQRYCEYEEPSARFAVADGATESILARQWAEMLVCAVAKDRLSLAHLADGLARLRSEWREWISEKPLPWYAEEKARQGTYAALVAVELAAPEPGQKSEGCWRAVALGDSCLFHTRGDEVLARFPLDNSAAFDNRPFLLGTIGGDEADIAEKISHCKGTWGEGDVFYLMTDALACWFLRQIEAGNGPLHCLRDLGPNEPGPFLHWIESLRDQGLIRNDDCTLLRICVS